MPMKRNVRKAMEAPEPEIYEPPVDEKKEAKQIARAAFLERKMGPRSAMRRYERTATRRRPSPEHHDD